MTRNIHVLAIASLAFAMVAAGCDSDSDSDSNTTTVTVTTTESSATAQSTMPTSTAASTTSGEGASSLLPTPAGTQRTDGPDPIQESGTHKHFVVNGSPTEVMDAYKTALEGAGWTVTVGAAGGGGGGGGATYTGTNAGSYGVFTGGGYGSTTDIQACAWPAKPSNTNCGADN